MGDAHGVTVMPQAIVPELNRRRIRAHWRGVGGFHPDPARSHQSRRDANSRTSTCTPARMPFHIPILGETVQSRTVSDGVLNTTTTVTLCDRSVYGSGCRARMSPASASLAAPRLRASPNATTIILSAAATATADRSRARVRRQRVECAGYGTSGRPTASPRS